MFHRDHFHHRRIPNRAPPQPEQKASMTIGTGDFGTGHEKI
jgi:hypothetical protein